MRGQNTLFTQMFPSSVASIPENKNKRNAYINERSDAMACRYYYYAELKRLRYDDCLLKLHKEFYLSPAVIAQTLTERYDFLKALVNKKATASEFRKLYPHLVWAA